jgi:zinc protease
MKNKQFKIQNFITIFSLIVLCCVGVFAQETPPAPSAPKSVKIPAVKEKTLKNDLKVAVIERKNIPLVTVQLVVKSGAQSEDMAKAGLADMTAALLTKGTATRSATDIAGQIEFLGGSINTGAGWNNSVAIVTVSSDKLDKALEIMSDAVLNPAFKQDEIELLKSQTQDGLAYNLTQPGFLANYVAAKYSFDEHPVGGTPASIASISRDDVVGFHKNHYVPSNAVLIFTGDISAKDAQTLTEKYFGKWNGKESEKIIVKANGVVSDSQNKMTVKRLLVVDLPNSGQAAVKYVKDLQNTKRNSSDFYPASVLNSVLGGGYSSRLNQEIRIKRGLSYGAGSGFAWRANNTNFSTSTQTKNESAAEVAELVIAEVNKLSEGEIIDTELGPRKLVLTGNFGRNLETTGGLAGSVAELYSFGIPVTDLNAYMTSVQSVSDAQIKKFAGENLKGGDIIIVGDYAKFKDDLAKRFPNMKVEVIEAAQIDLSKDNLKK